MIKTFLRVLLVLLAVQAGQAWAAAPATMYAKYGSTNYIYSTYDAACSASSTTSITFVFGGGGQCHGTYTSGGDAGWFSVPTKVACYDGSAPDLGKPTAQQCGDPPPPPGSCPAQSVGALRLTSGYATGPDVGSGIALRTLPPGAGLRGSPNQAIYCKAGCIVLPSANQAGSTCKQEQTAGPNGYYRIYCDIQYDQTPQPCTAAANGDASPVQDPKNTAQKFPAPDALPSPPSTPNTATHGECPQGSTPGGLTPDGMTVCVGVKSNAPPASSTSTAGPTTTSTDSAGNSVSTSTNSVTNSDGSVTTTTTKVTTLQDGTKTTSVSLSTSPATGGGTGKADLPPDENDLCMRHPELNVCKNSQVTGQCETITCDGDAIQCATLKQAAAIQCKMKKDADDVAASPSFALGTAIASGADPLASTLPNKANGDQVTIPSSLDNTGWLGGGACFADKSFVVQGHTITLPLSKTCDYLLALRYALMVVASLVSLRILSSAVLT